ncbi:MAG: aminotransferase class I/II-fold pyridoxal phosphate-dependent enzyme [Oscillospiraceae bacterium]|nr:aminotransferase class I/II-fold pyridoxal phosphate-dependent enzyme [Oscillospiraceae bacterium]
MKSFVAKTIRDLPPSGIRKFFDVAAVMEDVVSLGVGEPDFVTPRHICDKAILSLEQGHTMYTSNSGLLELREEISRYMSKYGLSYDPETQVLVTVGASEDIDISLRAIIEPGDEVIIVEPCFVAYKPCVIMAGGVPVTIETRAENEFRVTAEEIKVHLTEKTKAVLLSYPCNPTGAILTMDELVPIADVLRDRDIVVISDEIYSELTYGDAPHVSIASLPGMADKTIVINGFSKSFAMTGWRLGFACGPVELIAAMRKIHQYVLMCAPTIAQYAGIEALRNGEPDVLFMKGEYDTRRRFLLDEFNKMGIDCFEARGAFYLFPSIAKFGLSSDDFCTRLLNEQRLAVVPGTAFGAPGEGHVRISYAYSVEDIKAALERLRLFIDSL